MRGDYNRINDNVFKSWSDTTAALRQQVDTFCRILMPSKEISFDIANDREFTDIINR